jgi:integration host factor subunit beta
VDSTTETERPLSNDQRKARQHALGIGLPLSVNAWNSIVSSSDAPRTATILADTDMTRTELVDRLSRRQTHLNHEDVAFAVKTLLDQMSDTLAHGGRIEIRGFGAFSLHRRRSRVSRNPLTGASVALPDRHVPHFKPGKELRERVNYLPLQ